jgi:hypothetical protein
MYAVGVSVQITHGDGGESAGGVRGVGGIGGTGGDSGGIGGLGGGEGIGRDVWWQHGLLYPAPFASHVSSQ